jgi:hypothetical protein
MNHANIGSQGGCSIPTYVTGHPTPTSEIGGDPRCQTGKVLGVSRIGPCRPSPEFICLSGASAAKWL